MNLSVCNSFHSNQSTSPILSHRVCSHCCFKKEHLQLWLNKRTFKKGRRDIQLAIYIKPDTGLHELKLMTW